MVQEVRGEVERWRKVDGNCSWSWVRLKDERCGG